jgi:hypothetical protein
MKQKISWIVGAIVLLCAIGFAVTARTQAPDRERWEYKSQNAGFGSASLFNSQGNEGWELVTVECQETGLCTYYFKRRK